MKSTCTTLLAAAALAALPASARAQATFTTMGGNHPRPHAASADGTWVTGLDFSAGFRWSQGTGFQAISVGFNGFMDIASGGSPVTTTLVNLSGDEEAGQWTPSGTTLFGGIGGQSGTSISSAYGASNNGGVVVGLAWVNAGQAHAFRWTQAGGMVDMGSQNPTRSSRANGVSGNGNMMVGWDEDLSGFRRPAIWPGTSGPGQWLSANPGEAWDANTNGTVVVGGDNGELFRWTQAGGLVHLGQLPNADPIFDDTYGMSVSDDGNTIVGWGGNSFFGTPPRALIWRPGAGVVDVKELLVDLGAASASGFDLSQAAEVSADGKTIVGLAGFPPFGPFEGWIATLPDSSTTYCTAKVNSSGCTPSIGSSGQASASSGAGFHITATNILPNVNGLFFFSTVGAAATPFSGGFLCFQPPVKRAPAQNSGGSGTCGGTFDTDFNAYVPVSGNTALVGGATVWGQYWSRDMLASFGTNLTNAISFTLWP